MTNEQPDILRLVRKGIYQAFDPGGNVVADERWRSKATLGNGLRIDTDTVRISPFMEARNESVSFELGTNMIPRRLVIHALAGRRESRVDIAPPRADICWRFDEVSRTREVVWTENCEISYNSPLFNMATLWRYPLEQGVSARLQVLQLDPVSFEPRWKQLTYASLGAERHDTRFGQMQLTHIRIDDSIEAVDSSHLWCDQTNVIFDFMASNGSGFKLVAVNFSV